VPLVSRLGDVSELVARARSLNLCWRVRSMPDKDRRLRLHGDQSSKIDPRRQFHGGQLRGYGSLHMGSSSE
jgi:hypothetical protein